MNIRVVVSKMHLKEAERLLGYSVHVNSVKCLFFHIAIVGIVSIKPTKLFVHKVRNTWSVIQCLMFPVPFFCAPRMGSLQV